MSLSPSTSTNEMFNITSLNPRKPDVSVKTGTTLPTLHTHSMTSLEHMRSQSDFNSNTTSPSPSPSSHDSTIHSNHSSPTFTPTSPTNYMFHPLEPVPIVISGVSLGLPNSNVPVDTPIFSQLNFDDIFEGRNCIQAMSADDKQDIVDMNSCQISKDKSTGERKKTYLKDDEQLIQCVAQMKPRSTWNTAANYGLPSHVMEVLDATYELAVCAGLEALKDAGFELKLSSSNPDEIGLPEHQRNETGVIFASSFPCLDSIISEVTKKVRHDTANEIREQLGVPRPAEGEDPYAYEYDRKLLFKLLVMANCQLAELIKARGPNIHMNTACSGTTQAIATAEDWIKVGRCKRVIVISADVATNETCSKYLATGFLALGAASILPEPTHAAAPFDVRRKGMILGTGSVGMVLEYASSCLARGATPKVELLGSHHGNSAYHATLMDSTSISQQLNIFIKRMESEKGLNLTGPNATEFTRDLIYFSHETSTSANGGCAKVELEALASVWSDKSGLTSARHEIMIANTKGLTGHPMGVGFEDVIAVESLHRGLVPPVANFKQLDPRLEQFIHAEQLSRGGAHSRNYVLRMAGGFGSQFVYLLYRKWTEVQQTHWQARLSYEKSMQAGLSQTRGWYSYPLPFSSSFSSSSQTNSLLSSRDNSESDLQQLVSSTSNLLRLVS